MGTKTKNPMDLLEFVEVIRTSAYESMLENARLSVARICLAGTFVGIGAAIATAEGLLATLGTDSTSWRNATLLLTVVVFLLVGMVSIGLANWLRNRSVPGRRTFFEQLLPEYLNETAYIPGWSWEQCLSDPWSLSENQRKTHYRKAQEEIARLENDDYPGLSPFALDWRIVPSVFVIVSLLLSAGWMVSEHQEQLGWFLTALSVLFVLVLVGMAWPSSRPSIADLVAAMSQLIVGNKRPYALAPKEPDHIESTASEVSNQGDDDSVPIVEPVARKVPPHPPSSKSESVGSPPVPPPPPDSESIPVVAPILRENPAPRTTRNRGGCLIVSVLFLLLLTVIAGVVTIDGKSLLRKLWELLGH